jgi:DNA replication protein DnaC
MTKKVNCLKQRKEPLQKEQLLNKLLRDGWYENYLSARWDDVEARGLLQKSLKAEYFGEKQPRGMFIYGNIGVGKTCLLSLIAQFLVKNFDGWAEYTPATVLFTTLMKGSITQQENIKNSPFLFIDDLGKEYDTDFPLSRFSELIEYRWANRMITYFSSNLDIQSIREKKGYEHIADRMNDDEWLLHFYYSGISKRIRKKN